MTVNTGTTTSENTPSANGSGVPTIEALTAAFSGARYMGEMDWDEPLEPDGHAAPAAPPVREALMRALLRLAARRQPHEIAMATYRNGDDAGLGTALQLVTDYTPLLTESITVLLRRQGVAIVDLMDPVFSVERAADGTLLSAAPVDHPQSDTAPNAECWIHLQLPPSIDAERLAFIETQLPHTLEDGSHVAADTDAMRDAVIELASDLDAAPGNARFSSAELTEVANLLRWLVDGTSRCWDTSGAPSRTGTPPSMSRAGWGCSSAAKRCSHSSPTTISCWCSRRPPHPPTCGMPSTRILW
ncbi:Probable NAD-dependent glutamate dehydrogenase [Mycobacteroides abscessus]|nr:Probable NAD-dependent glutamate dehydrogenase [Mycobacteroides abscessus]